MAYGVCRFCGQQIALMGDVDKEYPQEERDLAATLRCCCSAGGEFRERTENFNKTLERVDILFGEDCTDTEFEAMDPEKVSFIKEVLQKMLELDLYKITINFERGEVARFTQKQSGAFKIERSKTSKNVFD